MTENFLQFESHFTPVPNTTSWREIMWISASGMTSFIYVGVDAIIVSMLNFDTLGSISALLWKFFPVCDGYNTALLP